MKSTKIKSLGYRTDFMFNEFDGSVERRDNYYVARTDSNPNYFWGNLLLYNNPPKKGDLDKWRADFNKEFQNPAIYHMTFAWDSPHGEVGSAEEFIEEGFELANSVVLTASDVSVPKKMNENVQLRVIEDDADFERCVDIQVSGASNKLSKKSWRGFYKTSMDQYRKMITAGRGLWFSAVLNEQIVGSLGIFTDGDVGRFQLVSTDPDFQRMGVCRTLVYKSAIYVLKKYDLNKLVMVADENYHAAKIYESVGFIPTEKQMGLCWWDKNRHC